MSFLREKRRRSGLSQRELARRAGLSFGTIQLIEAEAHQPNLNTLAKLLGAFGVPAQSLTRAVEELLNPKRDSARGASRRIAENGEDSWKIWLYNFVDAFRRSPRAGLAADAPVPETPVRVRALLASTVERLCAQAGVPVPWWCAGAAPLPEPWFAAGMESLKASALVESPAEFRKRDIFVLRNFLDRA